MKDNILRLFTSTSSVVTFCQVKFQVHLQAKFSFQVLPLFSSSFLSQSSKKYFVSARIILSRRFKRFGGASYFSGSFAQEKKFECCSRIIPRCGTGGLRVNTSALHASRRKAVIEISIYHHKSHGTIKTWINVSVTRWCRKLRGGEKQRSWAGHKVESCYNTHALPVHHCYSYLPTQLWWTGVPHAIRHPPTSICLRLCASFQLLRHVVQVTKGSANRSRCTRWGLRTTTCSTT